MRLAADAHFSVQVLPRATLTHQALHVYMPSAMFCTLCVFLIGHSMQWKMPPPVPNALPRRQHRACSCPAAWESKEAFLKYIKKEDTKGRQICKYIQASAKCFLGGVASACVRKLAPMMCIDAGPLDPSMIFICVGFPMST